MPDDLRTRISALIVGELLGQAEARGDYAGYDFDPAYPSHERVHLDTSIDPFAVADAVIRELGLKKEWLERPHSEERDIRWVTDWMPDD